MFDFYSVCILAVALAMDAFSVSITKGFTQKHITHIHALWYGIFFGFFQFAMTVLGYFCGSSVSSYISSIATWIGFLLLLFIGLNMIRESISNSEEEVVDTFSFKEVFILAIATSIDAFAVGLSFALINMEIVLPSIIIGITSFILSIFGVFLGSKLEARLGKYLGDKLEIIGGVVLIILGIKILLGF
nr:manganese efflux pump MntP family protein [Methanosphaera cuniculi]